MGQVIFLGGKEQNSLEPKYAQFCAAVSGSTFYSLVECDGPRCSIALCGESFTAHLAAGQVVDYGQCPALRQGQVICGCADIVCMPFDAHLQGGVFREQLHQQVELCRRAGCQE